ncbi:hypothetical protein PCYB_007550, partial [Plasmodium cynomolgi strain B]
MNSILGVLLRSLNHILGNLIIYPLNFWIILTELKNPILKYISYYFVQYYIYGYNYYKDSLQHHRNGACSYLNHWLEEKKDLFTYGGKCTENLRLWERNIESLWEMLDVQEYHIIKDKFEVKSWCKQIPRLSKLTNFPKEVNFSNCEERISGELYRVVPHDETITTECKCSEYELPKTSQI